MKTIGDWKGEVEDWLELNEEMLDKESARYTVVRLITNLQHMKTSLECIVPEIYEDVIDAKTDDACKKLHEAAAILGIKLL